MVDLNSVDLNLLVALEVLLEESSVRGAARRLGLTPPAMSHKLKRIRELLDDEVLVRAGRGMVATPRAESLVVPLRELLRQTRTVLASPAPFDPRTLERAFRVICTDHVSTVLLPYVERLLAIEAPGVDLFVCPVRAEMMEQLRDGEADVAVRVQMDAPPEMRARRLFDDRFVTVARPEHPRVRGPELALDAYLAEQHVLVAPNGSPHGPIDELLRGIGRTRRVARTRPNFLAALWLVSESDALLTVSRRIVAATADRFDLRVLPVPLPVEDYELTMYWHPRVDASQDGAWLRSLLRRAADEVRQGPPAQASDMSWTAG